MVYKFHKIVCVFLIVWLIASPAYAATSSSALDWQVAPMSLDDGIAPASIPSGATFREAVGYFNPSVGTWYFGNNVTLIDGYGGNLFCSYTNTFSDGISRANIYPAIRLSYSGLSYSGLSSFRNVMGGHRLFLRYDSNSSVSNPTQYDLSATASPFLCYAEVNYTVNGSSGNTHYSKNITLKRDISFYLSEFAVNPNFNTPSWRHTLDFTIPAISLSEFSDDSFSAYSCTVNSFDIYVCYQMTESSFVPTYLNSSSLPGSWDFINLVAGMQPFSGTSYTSVNVIISNSPVSDSSVVTQSIGNLAVNLTSQLSNLTLHVTNQISEVKQTISQGASEVKNEISNQTQTLTDKLTDLKDGIVEGVTELKETTEQGFEDVVQGITDLPGKIQEMLTDFIVPDEDAVADKMTDFQSLAEEKLGVVYQVPTMMFDMAEGIISGVSNPEGEMVLPKFEIIMPATNQTRSGETLTVWEEYRFAIWPAGTEVIQTAVQTATSMICVIFTFNALKRKYEEWLDGH